MSRNAGFTLMEFLVALSLTALVGLLLHGALDFGIRARQGSSEAAEARERRLLLWQWLKDHLAGARFRGPWPPGVRWSFRGTETALEFITPMTRQTGAGLYLVRLELEGDRLRLRRWFLHPEVLSGAGGAPAWHPLPSPAGTGTAGADGGLWYAETRLLEGVRRLRWRYAAARKDPDWQPRWLDRQDPPALVRLELETASGPRIPMVFRLPPS